jgi:hypothetical protein
MKAGPLRQRGGAHRWRLGQPSECRHEARRVCQTPVAPPAYDLSVGGVVGSADGVVSSPPSGTSSESSVTTRGSTPSPRPTSRQVKGGCDETTLKVGRLPRWTLVAKPPTGLPFALSRHRDVVGILFGYSLRAGHPAIQLIRFSGS